MKFSIIIPLYNSEKWIERCIKSVLNQTYTNYELIVVDDMSTDKSVQIAKKLIKEPNKLIELKCKRLTGGTRNEGIVNASGDYIICIDCDDWLIDNNVLEDINNKLNNEDIMYLGYKRYKSNNQLILNINNKIEAINNGFNAPWLKVVKRELYLEHLLPEGTLYEDRINNIELSIYANSYTNLGRATHIWNRENENATTFNPILNTYRFEYCGELVRLINKIEDKDIKELLINELNIYNQRNNEMVGQINENN